MSKLAFADASTSGVIIPNAAAALQDPLDRLAGLYAQVIQHTGAKTRESALHALNVGKADVLSTEEEVALDLDLRTPAHVERLRSLAWKKALDAQGVGGR